MSQAANYQIGQVFLKHNAIEVEMYHNFIYLQNEESVRYCARAHTYTQKKTKKNLPVHSFNALIFSIFMDFCNNRSF